MPRRPLLACLFLLLAACAGEAPKPVTAPTPAKPEVAQLESPRAADSGAQYATAPAFDTTGLEQRLDALLAATEKQTAQQQRNNGGENAPDVSTMYRTQACNDIAFG